MVKILIVKDFFFLMLSLFPPHTNKFELTYLITFFSIIETALGALGPQKIVLKYAPDTNVSSRSTLC